MKSNYCKEIGEEFFGFPIFLVIGDREYLISAVRRKFKSDGTILKQISPHNTAQARVFHLVKNEVSYFVLWFRDFKWTLDDHGYLTHEVTHIVNITYTIIEHTHDVKNDELQAYHTAYLIRKIGAELLRYYDKTKKRKKRTSKNSNRSA